jgi:uncharacterized protein
MEEPLPNPLEGPQQLSPRIVPLWRLRGASWALAMAMVGALPGLITGSVPLTATGAGAVAVVGLGLAWWLPAVAHRRWRYELTGTTLELRHGVVLLVESSIPHFRVQHVDIKQGPLDRWLGIAQLDISTASSSTDATVPGIEADRAEVVRRHILERAQATEGV